jgi:hypothetical protein
VLATATTVCNNPRPRLSPSLSLFSPTALCLARGSLSCPWRNFLTACPDIMGYFPPPSW